MTHMKKIVGGLKRNLAVRRLLARQKLRGYGTAVGRKMFRLR